MAATVQIIFDAIETSKRTGEIVHIRAGAGIPEDQLQDIRESLYDECLSDTHTGTVSEYWGRDLDEVGWRVHVHND